MTDANKDGAPSAGADMWGGRFEGETAPLMQKINASIDVDRRLWREDLEGSRAHARMLAAQGVIAREDADAILGGLETIADEIERGVFVFDPALEDIHMNVEARLTALIGEPGRRLHTARSRNDQVATDAKLWTRRAFHRADRGLLALQQALCDRAEEHAASAMPGFTHLQAAQPVTLGHHLLAYVEMFGRDRSRFADAIDRAADCPLGAAALAGTSFPIDRDATAQALGFARPSANSIDAVSDRDFALDYLSAAAITAGHLSRLAEELVLWATPQFGFVRLPDSLSTGSSIMPQKRNPDAAELVRAKSGKMAGALLQLLTVVKGLPLAYSKDMQEDKAPLFGAADDLELALAIMTQMIAEATFEEEAMAAAAGGGFSTATDLADWLVREKKTAFRDAHHVVGAVVKRAETMGCALWDLPLDALQEVDPRLDERARACLSVDASVGSRTSFGGAAPLRVRQSVADARTRFALQPRE